ncbi:uncharacterized protein MONBRDRAFT_5869 [Monosiga brevicollis MX1]|uniref:Mediator of RNA polymerase II transcription subunit 21 n=1 Tax=Monosiga brevicollis TaxID=81824 RepID=A9USQ5_MONBE|nr:uncharacterized protein MONBRDRAFT_5869 [Monosiga brevicollis MX1]EDQ92143.1 predicted protein [Monosiga brevicollis MX1]|eukprot:XP_001743429.1 hypothetical protein [Monosiga brevicollis MX1]
MATDRISQMQSMLHDLAKHAYDAVGVLHTESRSTDARRRELHGHFSFLFAQTVKDFAAFTHHLPHIHQSEAHFASDLRELQEQSQGATQRLQATLREAEQRSADLHSLIHHVSSQVFLDEMPPNQAPPPRVSASVARAGDPETNSATATEATATEATASAQDRAAEGIESGANKSQTASPGSRTEALSTEEPSVVMADALPTDASAGESASSTPTTERRSTRTGGRGRTRSSYAAGPENGVEDDPAPRPKRTRRSTSRA